MALSVVVGDVLWNFDIIASINIHQTLLVDGNRLNFDNRYFQFLRRPLTGDSRDLILQVIEKNFTVCEEILHSYQCNMYINEKDENKLHQEQKEIVGTIYDNLNHFIERKSKVINGLKILATFERYNDDPSFRIEMKRFVDRLEKLIKKCEALKLKMKHLVVEKDCDIVVEPDFHAETK
jgi:hypothetical protein